MEYFEVDTVHVSGLRQCPVGALVQGPGREADLHL